MRDYIDVVNASVNYMLKDSDKDDLIAINEAEDGNLIQSVYNYLTNVLRFSDKEAQKRTAPIYKIVLGSE